MLCVRHDRLRCRSIGIEHMLLEAWRVSRQDKPRNCALGEDVRTWSYPRGIVEGSTIENLYCGEAFERQANAVAARTTEAEIQRAPMMRGAMPVGGKRDALEFNSFLQEHRLDGKRAARGSLAHGAVAHEYLQGSTRSCEAEFAAQTATAMDLRHSNSPNMDDARCGA